MNEKFLPGKRCRALRSIAHQRGILQRGDEGTVLAARENLGRHLVTVDFETGGRLVLFAHEIEPVGRQIPQDRVYDAG